MHENSAQIVLKDIEKAYGSRKILDGINMEICPGDFICIYGKSERLRRYKIAYMFQNFALVEKMTVKENLLLALQYARVKNKTRAMEEALTHLGVADKMNSKIFELYGGEQQRVALARNLIKPFDILLADEPTGSLDRENRKIAKKNYNIEGGQMYRI